MKKEPKADSALDIRQLGPDDAGAYKALRTEGALDPMFGANPELEKSFSIALAARTLAEQENGFVLGAFLTDELVGMVGFGMSPAIEDLDLSASKGTLFGLFVSPGFRRMGIGQRLVRKLLNSSLVSTIELFVETENRAAVALYLGEGFVQVDDPDAEAGLLHLSFTQAALGSP